MRFGFVVPALSPVKIRDRVFLGHLPTTALSQMQAANKKSYIKLNKDAIIEKS
jgi:hypothetical protein